MYNATKSIKRYFSTYSFAVVGSGPGGIYTAKHLYKSFKNVKVDFFDQLPNPFGLIRTGVAPDHQDTKKVTSDFQKTLDDTNSRFFGNVNIGSDISIKDLLENYSGVILSYGATEEYHLGLENEESNGIFSSRRFVNWYNGHVDFSSLKFPLDSKNAVVIGNGNVAIDIVRLLAKPKDDLSQYDINSTILNEICNNKIKNIFMIGRRGIAQSAFTMKEMRELSKVNKLKIFAFEDELKLDPVTEKEVNAREPIIKKQILKKIELYKSFNLVKNENELNSKLEESDSKNLVIRFFQAPHKIHSENSNLKALTLRKTQLKEENNKSVLKTLDDEWKIDTEFLIKSIGYKPVSIFDEIGFDHKKNSISNEKGVVKDKNGNIMGNVFAVGWVKNGAKGVVDTTLRDSYETAESIINYLNQNKLITKEPKIEEILKNKNINYVKNEQWKKIDQFEIDQGKNLNKLREKVIKRESMLNIALN